MKLLSNPPRPRAHNRFKLTPLNREVNRKYRACERGSGHVKSGVIVERLYNAVPWAFDCCQSCGVPIRVRLSETGWAA